MKILLIEDDERIIDFLERGLKQEGHEVAVARNGADGLHLASATTNDLVILDLMLPVMDGRMICETLRMNKVGVKILMLSALGSTDEIVQGLRLGADDYMTKPFAFAELLARIDLLHERTSRDENPPERTFHFGNIELDRRNRKVTKKGRLIDLPALEFKLLEFLLLNIDQIVSRDQIFKEVWGATEGQKNNIVDVYIRKLRQKIFADCDMKPISTIRGMGYRLNSIDPS
jgi:two-component system OmpR family response regulator